MKTSFKLSERSENRLVGVHPDLVRVVRTAIKLAYQDFTVLEGVRSMTRQQQLYDAGASKTLRSRHLTGHAVDLAPLDRNEVSWHWPHYHVLAATMFRAAEAENVEIEWGGDWRKFKDGPHWQLPWKSYPAKSESERL